MDSLCLLKFVDEPEDIPGGQSALSWKWNGIGWESGWRGGAGNTSELVISPTSGPRVGTRSV